jgi:hypothetical protein
MNLPIADKKVSEDKAVFLKRTVFERIQIEHPLHAILLEQMIETGQVILL